MREFMETLIGGIDVLGSFTNDVLELLLEGVGDNPRQVKRFINTFLLNHQLASEVIEKDYNPKVLAAILVIQYRSPELFKAASSDPDLLRRIAIGKEVDKQIVDSIGTDKRLAHVVKQAGFSGTTQIMPYVFLSEVSAVRNVTFDVILSSYDPTRKIPVIKVLREQLSIGLAEAKALSEIKLPATIGSNFSKDKAEEFVKSLLAIGAAAELR